MVCPSTLRLSELSGGWVLGSVSFLEVTVAAGQVQRGEGTVSLLCLGVWGAGLAGDAPPRRKVGGALPIWWAGSRVPCPLTGNMALLWAPGPPLASSVPVCAGMGAHSVPVSHRGWSSSAFVPPHSSFTEAVMSLPAVGPVGSWP